MAKTGYPDLIMFPWHHPLTSSNFQLNVAILVGLLLLVYPLLTHTGLFCLATGSGEYGDRAYCTYLPEKFAVVSIVIRLGGKIGRSTERELLPPTHQPLIWLAFAGGRGYSL